MALDYLPIVFETAAVFCLAFMAYVTILQVAANSFCLETGNNEDNPDKRNRSSQKWVDFSRLVLSSAAFSLRPIQRCQSVQSAPTLNKGRSRPRVRTQHSFSALCLNTHSPGDTSTRASDKACLSGFSATLKQSNHASSKCPSSVTQSTDSTQTCAQKIQTRRRPRIANPQEHSDDSFSTILSGTARSCAKERTLNRSRSGIKRSYSDGNLSTVSLREPIASGKATSYPKPRAYSHGNLSSRWLPSTSTRTSGKTNSQPRLTERAKSDDSRMHQSVDTFSIDADDCGEFYHVKRCLSFPEPLDLGPPATVSTRGQSRVMSEASGKEILKVSSFTLEMEARKERSFKGTTARASKISSGTRFLSRSLSGTFTELRHLSTPRRGTSRLRQEKRSSADQNYCREPRKLTSPRMWTSFVHSHYPNLYSKKFQ